MEKTDKKTTMVPLKELNLTDRFLFDQVMEDPETQKEVLSIIFGKEISVLSHNESEKELRVAPQIRSIRMDIYSVDDANNVYATEMQGIWKTDLAKRSRYYQSVMDTSLLEPGVPNYNCLNNTYLIMFMTFDLFGYGKYKYTFRPKCEEAEGCELQDGTTRIFLNIHGKNEGEVSEELVALLHYFEQTTDSNAEDTGSERICRIHERVQKVKMSEEVGVKYMQAWEERYFARREAIEEGKAEGREIGRAEGIAEGRTDMLRDIVFKMMNKGYSVGIIAETLDKTEGEIQQLIKEV